MYYNLNCFFNIVSWIILCLSTIAKLLKEKLCIFIILYELNSNFNLDILKFKFVGGEKHTGGGRESGSDAWKQYMRRSTW